jgi:hypothetical protein
VRRLALVVVLALAITACQETHLQDIDTETRWLELSTDDLVVSVGAPDSIEVFRNVQLHPNLARICIDGVAFLTTTRDLDAVDRIPEWDEFCQSER